MPSTRSRPSSRSTRSWRTRMPLRSSRARASASSSHAPSVHSVTSRLQPVSSSDSPRPRCRSAIDRKRRVTHFPAVAVRTMEDAAAIELAEPGDVRQVVDHAGGDQQPPRGQLLTVGEADREPLIGPARGAGDFDVAQLDRVVAPQLLARDPQEFARIDAVAREESVHRVRRGVARLAGVADEDAPPAAAENQRRAQSGGAGPDNDDVVHAIMLTRLPGRPRRAA